ncbi:MAG: ABC transporter substrate-binding protein, partial [Gemmatimonadaceae bacterium]
MMRRRARASTVRRCVLALALGLAAGCSASPTPVDTVVYASGADLESGNPLVTIHPLARQVQRYMLFVTLAKYDSALQPVPYYARRWAWSDDQRALTFTLASGLAWQDGRPTTSRDVAFTIDAARDPRTGYPRYADLADVAGVDAPNDTTVTLRFRRAQPDFPLVLCELPIVPAHLLASVPRADMRRAPFDTMPVGNGPFRFVERRPGERWVFARNDAFPAALGGPPNVSRVVIAIVNEPSTKFAGLVSGELDVAGISPAMAGLVRGDPSLRVIEYPVQVSYGIVFNVGRAPFDDARVRRAIGVAIDRRRIVQAALYGFATPAVGPVPAEHPDASADTAVLD